jgi:hypothetical protein
VQERLHRVSVNYTYGRAKIITTQISINGRTWHTKEYCDYMASTQVRRNLFGNDNKRLRVGRIQDFVVVSYTHKNIESMRGRYRKGTLEGQFMFVRVRQYKQKPSRESSLWVAPKRPKYMRDLVAVPVRDLCSILHKAPERNGRVGYVNLVTVAKAYVND